MRERDISYFLLLCVTLIDALHTYNEINKTLPEQIILYRDGVGDGQVCFSIKDILMLNLYNYYVIIVV